MWGHVSSTVNGTEGEASVSVGLGVTGDLGINEVWSPLLVDFPTGGGDPVLGSEGWDSTISVSREVEHAHLAHELLIDPLRSLWLDNVVPPVAGLAEIPSLNVVWDVEGLSGVRQVHPVEETTSPSAWWQFLQDWLSIIASSNWALEPWGVLVLGDELSVVVTLLGASVHLWSWSKSPACSIDIVDVDVRNVALELIKKSEALCGGLGVVWTSIVAFGGSDFVVELSWDKRVPVRHLDESGIGVISPVGDSVSNGESLDVWLEDIVVVSVGLGVLNEVVGEVWNVDSSIRLSRDVELVRLELWVLLEPGEDGGEVISTRLLVIE